LAKEARTQTAEPINILNEIIHNASVVNELQGLGMPSVKKIDDVKTGTLIISAHGVTPQELDYAKAKGLNVIDTTCPLVKYIHRTAKDYIAKDYIVVLFGDPGHDEVKGIVGIAPDSIWVVDQIEDINKLPEFKKSVAFISQSTRSLDDFQQATEKMKNRFPSIMVKNTICKPSMDRQKSIRQLAPLVELVIVVGSENSANSQRLASIAKSLGTQSYLIDNAGEVKAEWFDGIEKIGLTAGASTPDYLVDEVMKKLNEIALQKQQIAEFEEAF
jgi:4-hydroxy-3-methylbut-2-enyl diphosphate reductase